jgi:hypothetical protein
VVQDRNKAQRIPPSRERPLVYSFGLDTFTWDVRNRLVGLQRGGEEPTAVWFGYDFRDRRVSRTNGLEPWNPYAMTHFLLDGENVVTELQLGVPTSVVHGPVLDQPIARGEEFFAPDHLGSTAMLFDGAGLVTQRYDYLPFGERETSNGTNPITLPPPARSTYRLNSSSPVGTYSHRRQSNLRRIGT